MKRTTEDFLSGKILWLMLLLLAAFFAAGCSSGREEARGEKKAPAGTGLSEGIVRQAPENAAQSDHPFSVTLRFAGDICFADNYIPMQYFAASGASSMKDVIDPEFVDLMTEADLMWINNEFCYSSRGEPLYGKMFTFRAAPENVKYLQELGVDTAGLANNHVFDYGEEAFLDTLEAIRGAGIPYVGAGRDLAEAMTPVYLDAGPLTVAYVAATRAEKYQIVTQEAAEGQPGVLRCYDNTLFLEAIREAAEQADYVIALPHWGTEHSTVLESEQTDGARAYIDAGADAVIGAHPHILQGMEFYNGRPVLYSLGNFWFDNYTIDTMIAEIRLTGTMHGFSKPDRSDVKTELILYPGTQAGVQTNMAKTPGERDRIFRYLEGISGGITIDENGLVSPVLP